MRMAKTRESLRSIKAVDKAEGLAKKSKNGTSSLANAAEETQNSRHETEVEYAGNEVQDKEERSGRSLARGAARFGQWGYRTTVRNIQRWRNRPRKTKAKVDVSKQLPPPKRLMLTQSAKQNSKKAIETVIKSLKNSAKVLWNSAKAVLSAIIAGGWIAVLIVVIIVMVAFVAGSVYAIFVPAEQNEILVGDVMSSLDAELYQKEQELLSSCQYDFLTYSGTTASWKEIVAVYAIKLNLDSNSPQEVVTFDEAKAEELRYIYRMMNTVRIETQTETKEVKRYVVDENGNYREITETVTIVYATLVRESLTAHQAADKYHFTDYQIEMLATLLDEKNNELWQGLLSSSQ